MDATSETCLSPADARPFVLSDWLGLFSVVFAAALARFWRLSDPSSMVFDEVYYAKDACNYLVANPELCMGSNNEVHPTVGKWLIAIGIRLFGFESFGWRFIPAVAGILTIAVMYLLARKIFNSWIFGSLAAGLLAIDPLHFVQSRTSMLDIFLPMFGLAAVFFVVLDKERMLEVARPTGLLTGRPWRVAAGIAGGLAVSTKWTGGFYLALVIFLTVAWEAGARKQRGEGSWVLALRQEWLSVAVWLVVLPLVVYVLSYVGQIHGEAFTAPWSEGSWGRALFEHHKYMWNYHTNLEATHGYQSPPWSWILLKRPVSYYFCSGGSCNPAIAEGDYSEIFAVGSPVVWWTSILAILGLLVGWFMRRDYKGAAGLILAGVLFTYGPWLIPGADRSAVFIFYLLPTVPFMILALVYWMHRIRDSWEGRAATAIFTAGAVAVFFFYLPLLTKQAIPQPQWQKRIWIFDNCDKPPGETVTTMVEVTENGKVKESPSEYQDNSSLPPTGWCWI